MQWSPMLSEESRKGNLDFMDMPFRVFLRVHFFRLIVVCSLLLGAHSLMAQEDDVPSRRGSKIIDDTTKQVYGPKTTQFFYEEDVLQNRPTKHFIDTAIRNFHRFTYVQRYNYLYQDLGNIGTSIRPLYYEVPEVIGVSSGFQTYDLYWQQERIRYFDTHSPYSNMGIILGGQGRSITKVVYSRNITPQWNFGANFRTLFIDKQVAREGKGDRNVQSQYYDFFTTYQTKDSTYRIFANFQRQNHRAAETGGIFDATNKSYEELFFDRNENALTEASSNQLRINAHIAHQYKIGSALQVYHVFDRYRQGERFNDVPLSEPDDYYEYYAKLDSPKVSDRVKFKYVRNEFGIKGNLAKLFYSGYYAIRDYSMTYNHLDTGQDSIGVKTSGTEHYLGGRISLRLDSIGEVTARAELLQTGNYRLEGSIQSRWFDASLKQVQYAPSFLQDLYRGNFHVWENNFTDVNVTQINGYLHYRSPVVSISPGVTFTRIGNYIFFKEDDFLRPNGTPDPQKVKPVQTAGEQVMVLPEMKVEVVMARHIFLRGHGIFAKVLENTGEAIQLPDLFVNGQLAYENIFFHGNFDIHTGVDVHYKSAYTPLAYEVPIQQYYVQREGAAFEAPDFPIIDVFLNARIMRARIFVKYNNILQAFTKQGYVPTPYYVGQRNVLDFGFDWSFYD